MTNDAEIKSVATKPVGVVAFLKEVWAGPQDPNEKPENGLKGLKYWRNDLVSGLVVSLVSLPFSLGIALASGAPPIAGILTAVIAGLLMPLMGGSYVTVSGPAAGLAPALLASMLTLGVGNKTLGYPMLLACIVIVGMIQFGMAKLKLARIGQAFPASVVEGMLAAIGAGIIVKQLPLLMGRQFHTKGFWNNIVEAFSPEIANADRNVLIISGVSLVVIFTIALGFEKRWKYAPVVAPIVGAVVGMILSFVLKLDNQYRIALPNLLENPLSAFTAPNFKGLLDGHIWYHALGVIALLVMIDATETLATIAGIDKKDPFSRRSDANKTLLGIGVCNVVCGMLGGLTNIPGGVKSTTNIVAGGKTLWSNMYNALLLVVYVTIGAGVVALMPLGTLGAVVCLMGYKLCKFAVWKHAAGVGKEQLLIFAVTFFVTVSGDLLEGIVAGLIAKGLLVVIMAKRTEQGRKTSWFRVAYGCSILSNPVKEVDAGVSWTVDGDYEIELDSPVTCFNSFSLQKALEKVPHDCPMIVVRTSKNVLIIDHTSMNNLQSFVEYAKTHRNVEVKLDLASMTCMSKHPLSLRVPASTPVEGLAPPV